MFNLTPAQLDGVIGQLEDINPVLPTLAVNAGFITDPGYLDFVTNPGTEFDPVYGGWNPALVLPDILQLFGIDAGSSGIGELVDPAVQPSGGFDAAVGLDLGALLSGFDPADVSADLATRWVFDHRRRQISRPGDFTEHFWPPLRPVGDYGSLSAQFAESLLAIGATSVPALPTPRIQGNDEFGISGASNKLDISSLYGHEVPFVSRNTSLTAASEFFRNWTYLEILTVSSLPVALIDLEGGAVQAASRPYALAAAALAAVSAVVVTPVSGATAPARRSQHGDQADRC